ncbi:MAG: hypothetical protein ACPLZA_06130 [Thermodesulfovibrio sp.]|uniref:hypothetical protein n=1 Tax=Thermodesulfovibrio sp. TaxID=2067987 RepID=UPI003C7B23F9
MRQKPEKPSNLKVTEEDAKGRDASEMDSSQPRLIEEIKEPWWLIAMVDDASRYIYAEFHSSETVWVSMAVLRAYIIVNFHY